MPLTPVKKLFDTSQRIIDRQHNTILSAAVVITGSSLLSALFGLLRNRLLLSRFFSTPQLQQQLDAYWVAFRLPELAFQLLVIGALSAAFIPVYARYRKESESEANALASTMMNLVSLTFLIISAVVFVFARPLNELITAQNFTPEQLDLTVNLTRIMLLSQLFFAFSNFLTGIIQAHQRFLIPALSPIAYNLGIIGGIVVLTPFIGIYSAAVGVVIGALFHLLLQFPQARKLGFRYSIAINLKHPGVKSMIRLMPPRTLALAVNQIELFVGVFLATALPSGSLTIVNIAQQLLSAPVRIFSAPIGQASLPFLSREAADGELTNFRNTFVSSFLQTMFLTLPTSALLLILRIPLVRLAYGSAQFPWQATVLTGRTLAVLSLSLFALGGLQVVNRAFYALHNTKIPFVVAIISAIVYVVGASLSVFVFKWNVVGLGLIMSIASIGQFLILLILLLKKIDGFAAKMLYKPMAKMISASLLMAVCLWIPMRLLDNVLDTTRVVPLIFLTILTSLSGAIVYLGFAKALHIKELAIFMELLKKVGNWRSVLTKSDSVLEIPTQSQDIKPL